ncbi:MAG TPA: HAD-IIIC family phosphatase [Actinocrinis sp.]|uniref:HAD-IIIC family phosphatase n=1 Tax=Actinocrinis sp. TaxID=1920516 RepID=UPI002D349DEA|nr:HAD-IIIC family phosphatase [Actinocrinis sp.]HZU55348.1 HAD-IIIC family phosphatase [Actinocrinis sp.]
MSVDVSQAPQTAVNSISPLSELRALKRQGLTGRHARVRQLLDALIAAGDPLDIEAAGMMLGGVAQREQLAAEAAFLTQNIALLGSSTLDSLPHQLTAALVAGGILPQVRAAGFNQWQFEIRAGAPNLADLAPGVSALLLDDTAVYEEVANPLDLDEVEARCAAFPDRLGEWADAARQVLGGLIVLSTIPLSPLRRDSVIDYGRKARLEAAWDAMNAGILRLAAQKPGVVVLSAAAIQCRVADTFATDRMRHVAGHIFSAEFQREYAAELARVVRAGLGRAAKCLVFDLDNTLWGGIVGDDGAAALKIGGAYPGSAHLELQKYGRDLAAQGVMLAVASKNDEDIAQDAIANHPEMLLRPESFVAVRANWEPKPGNVRQLASALNIGVDSMVFVDDNPVERGLMRELLPQVTTVELPNDPAGYAATVARRGDFNLLTLTDEDLKRTEMYRAQVQREELQSGSGSLEEYLLGLDSQLTVERLGEFNAARIVQLFGKTNQFNLTGIRYTEEEVRRRSESGEAAFFGGRLKDRFGDNGLIAAWSLTREGGGEGDGGGDGDRGGAWRIENFVMSCRVFSRNVEDAVVGLILRAAAAAGAGEVRASFIPTAKNAKFAGFYPALGFERVEAAGEAVDEHADEQGPAQLRHTLRDLAELPSWIGVTREEEINNAF